AAALLTGQAVRELAPTRTRLRLVCSLLLEGSFAVAGTALAQEGIGWPQPVNKQTAWAPIAK
ncbi:hypothetical protein AB9E06_34080, partial [Rhizobium leguminosarum]|uniref:hypothetical protein n=1 Tax=Rhizobium leguminosarum TaxID=384 RepID=UPI003F9D3FD9